MENDKCEKPQKVRAVSTAFDGLDPNGLDYLYRSGHGKVPFPFVAGGFVNVLTLQVPPHFIWDISGIEFFGLVDVGGNWVEVPDDFFRESIVMRVLRNDMSPWNYATLDLGGNPHDGSDVLNRNILGSFGSTPGHLIFTGGSTLTVRAEVISSLFVAPQGLRAGVRISGREVQKDKWEEVAR